MMTMRQKDSDKPGFCGIVLAGGRSTRMGTDKADLLIDGRTFLETQVRKLRHLGAGEILISGRSSSLPGTRSVPDLDQRRRPSPVRIHPGGTAADPSAGRL